MNQSAQGRTRVTTWLGAAFVGVCFLGAGQANAAKEPKVEICHLDADTGVFTKISVSGNAVQKHLNNHGDVFPGTPPLDEDCNEVIAPDVLARAYIDKNRNGMYDPSVDIDIMQLLDTADDDVPSVGDTIELGQYPLTFDPCIVPADPCGSIGNFNPPSVLTVADVLLDSAGTVLVESTAGGSYFWKASSTLLEEANIRDAAGSQRVHFFDALRPASGLTDTIRVLSSGEAGPSDLVPVLNILSENDDYFINVEFPGLP